MRDLVAEPVWMDVSQSHQFLSDTEAEGQRLMSFLEDDVLAMVVDELVDDLLDTLEEHTAASDTTHAVARCADGQGTLTHLFFSDDEFDLARAKAICRKCRLAESCLSGALERAEAYGVWGGELVIEGTIVAVKRGRGRPPKNPRPVLVVDEVPVPPHLVA